MTFDRVLTNGTVVDGTGAPSRIADVGIVGERIAAIGDLGADAPDVVDCTGLVVAPGFIDIHTHYDAQILWDPDLTPSSWYGVTSVVMGNCGFSIAPMRPDQRSAWIETLENVEAMSKAALETGISWEFESFDEYLDAIESRSPSINVGALVGHTTLRMSVMGDEAFDRTASDEEISEMVAVLDSAMTAGAIGFTTSRSASHVGSRGRPVPSRVASKHEIAALATVLRGSNGVVQGVNGPDFHVPEFAQLAEISGRPVTWCSLHQGVNGGRHWEYSAATEQARQRGLDLWAQMECLPNTVQFALDRPFILESVPAFGELSGSDAAERVEAFRDPQWRRRALEEIEANREGRSFEVDFAQLVVRESPSHPDYTGLPVTEIAGPSSSPFDAMVDLSLEDEFQTRFALALFNTDEAEVSQLLQQPSSLLGLSDAGAHASMLCDASQPLHLLSRFVRDRKDFSLEYAVWRLTGNPAEVFGLTNRGDLRPGSFADVCVFDPETVGEGREERVYDFPAGADRLIKEAFGIEHVLVNGQYLRRAGAAVNGARHGRVLRNA